MSFSTTELEPATPLRFVVFGDGGSGLPAQKRIAEQLARYHQQHPFHLVLLLGDNIYPNGDALKYGESRFTALYQPLLEQQVIFKPVLGNHDISGPLGVGYPAFWMSNRRENMRFFNMPDTYYDFIFGPFHFFMLDTNRFRQTQRKWLNTAFAKSDDSAIKIVCGHHPVMSSGFHGSTPRLKRHLKPMLEKHGAAFYLSAHEHDYERFEPVNEVTYIVSGGGGADLREFRKKAEPASLIRASRHHFMAFEYFENCLSAQVIDDTGNVLDQFSINLPLAVAQPHPHLQIH
ncbi:metallophosphoesterase [Vampirovibrio sp.]|uniref:metallophosphoesterase n=1 Tax=Vampirovibrio sp. TaxID=2717857 RepID=UPI003593EC73